MVQLKGELVEETAMKQILESPSKRTCCHLSLFAICTAQRSASAWAWRGERWEISLAQTLHREPQKSLATTAIATLELDKVASTFILIQLGGGGDHQGETWGKRDGEVGEDTSMKSWTYLRISWMEFIEVAELLEWSLESLSLHIFSKVEAIVRETFHWSMDWLRAVSGGVGWRGLGQG